MNLTTSFTAAPPSPALISFPDKYFVQGDTADVELENVPNGDYPILVGNQNTYICSLIHVVGDEWTCQLNDLFVNEPVFLSYNGGYYGCSPSDCYTNVVIKPSFTTPSEMIEGEEICVDFINPHP